MQATKLPNDAKAGPTKPEVRAVLARKLALGPDDHFVEVGSCTGAVTIEAAHQAGRVTALERRAERLETTRANLAANEYDADVELVNAEAPERLPDDGDVVFLGGSRNYERVLDAALDAGYDRVVMNVSRLEVAGEAARAFRDRDVLDEVLCLQMATGYDLAGATSFDADNPVYMLVAEPGGDGGSEGDR
ncbi:precorrin-6Y C5,15-methyltransferase (decarboxylating) subunit CbiT [Halorubrum distributum]|uniref:Precorrin-6y C5,15-methyltransferase subunit CbiT n=1 Tax=Halorubrum distributum JCM 10247 TaxID=1227486 RepID=M0DRQ8_9EURY|nr:precorrin-6Y C5,15-methyltransferase (decarboxylating) subunit CbiT [Halorubrum terrestre]ELZ38201.1 precorrin-6y C5,15-methyltransferase subunit CbiT [Halorubrum terrestre JCM 10247]